MSEYQYYEFRAIDRPLNDKEMAQLRAISTRAEITATSLTNTYQYGDFRGKPADLMDRYFDAFVYVANWGTHELMFRIPRQFLDVKAASAYCEDEILTVRAKDDHVVIEFTSQDESGGEWTEGEGWMSSLISLRADLIRGDFRALYLAWLASLPPSGYEDHYDKADRPAPPVPPGLAKLSAPLQSLVEFLRVDESLIEVAAAGNAGEPPAEPSQAEIARWIKGLPATEKDAYLLRFFNEEGDLLLRAELSKRFREATLPKSARPVRDSDRRTVADLLAARCELVEGKQRKSSEKAAQQRTQREREMAEVRAKALDDLARREPAAWREVDALIDTKRPKEYDRAVALLVDLSDLGARSDRTLEVESRIRDLRQRHRGKSSLIARLDGKKLGE